MTAYIRAATAASILVFNLCATCAAAEQPPLDLATAERIALQWDVSVPALQASAEALKHAAVADGQLPDPKLKLGAMNLPTDSFSRSQEPMTQLQLGVQQAFPPGQTLQQKQLRSTAMAEAAMARAESQLRAVLRDTRLDYLELYYQVQAAAVIEKSRHLFDQLLDVTESHYAAGRKNQQDVLRADVELALLEDRAQQIQTAQEKARAALAKRIGTQAAQGNVGMDFPQLPNIPPVDLLRRALHQHPLITEENHQVEAGQAGVNLARERYKPGWMLDLTYGERTGTDPDGSARSDFLSAMVLLDIPLFTAKRQDRVLSGEQQKLHAMQLERDDQLRELQRMLNEDYAEWTRLQERIERYDDRVLPQAKQNARSSLSAYQSGVTDFSGLMRARLTEIDTQLTALRLRTDHAKAQARLLYLAGESR